MAKSNGERFTVVHPRSQAALRGNRCRCACGLHFTTASTFDRHRVGAYGTLTEPGDRRCLTEIELAAKGWTRNGKGFWQRSGRAIGRALACAGAAIAFKPYPNRGVPAETARA